MQVKIIEKTVDVFNWREPLGKTVILCTMTLLFKVHKNKGRTLFVVYLGLALQK